MHNITKSILLYLGIMVFLLAFSSCTRYQATSTKLFDDMGLKYETVDTIRQNPKAGAFYDHAEDKIYIKKGGRTTYKILHEQIHQIRRHAGFDITGRNKDIHRLEEIITVKATYIIAQKAKLQLRVGKWEIPSIINDTLRANNIIPRRLTEEEKIYIDKQIENTVLLFVEELRKAGYSLYDIDWIKTAAFLI